MTYTTPNPTNCIPNGDFCIYCNKNVPLCWSSTCPLNVQRLGETPALWECPRIYDYDVCLSGTDGNITTSDFIPIDITKKYLLQVVSKISTTMPIGNFLVKIESFNSSKNLIPENFWEEQPSPLMTTYATSTNLDELDFSVDCWPETAYIKITLKIDQPSTCHESWDIKSVTLTEVV